MAGGDAGVLSWCQSGAGGLQVGHEDGLQCNEGACQTQTDPSDPRTGEKHQTWADFCLKSWQCPTHVCLIRLMNLEQLAHPVHCHLWPFSAPAVSAWFTLQNHPTQNNTCTCRQMGTFATLYNSHKDGKHTEDKGLRTEQKWSQKGKCAITQLPFHQTWSDEWWHIGWNSTFSHKFELKLVWIYSMNDKQWRNHIFCIKEPLKHDSDGLNVKIMMKETTSWKQTVPFDHLTRGSEGNRIMKKCSKPKHSWAINAFNIFTKTGMIAPHPAATFSLSVEKCEPWKLKHLRRHPG